MHELNAANGDYIFVIAGDNYVEFQILHKEILDGTKNRLKKLAHLVGVKKIEASDDAVLTAIIAAFRIEKQSDIVLEQQVKDMLIRRGEDDLADLIKPPKTVHG